MKHPQVNASLEKWKFRGRFIAKNQQKMAAAADKAQRYAIFKTNIDKKKQILENK